MDGLCKTLWWRSLSGLRFQSLALGATNGGCYVILSERPRREHTSRIHLVRRSHVYLFPFVCTIWVFCMGFLRGNLCVRARYPIRGMLGITARRFARDMQEAVFEDFDRTRSPRNGSVRDTSLVQHVAAEPGSAAEC